MQSFAVDRADVEGRFMVWWGWALVAWLLASPVWAVALGAAATTVARQERLAAARLDRVRVA